MPQQLKHTIYIAGPMTNIPKFNRPAFSLLAADLRAKGHTVINPGEFPERDSWEGYMRLGIAALMACDTIYMLPNWKLSRGAVIEHTLAHQLGIRRKYID